MEWLRLTAAPAEAYALRKAAFDAYVRGCGRDIEDENKEIDLGLQELQKKKRLTQADYIYKGSLAGLSKKESLFCCPGEIEDLYKVYLRANGFDKQEADD